jgi:hypothetical protein
MFVCHINVNIFLANTDTIMPTTGLLPSSVASLRNRDFYFTSHLGVLPVGKYPLAPTGQEVGLVPEMIWPHW